MSIRATHAAEDQEEYKPAASFEKLTKKEREKVIATYGKRNEGSGKGAQFRTGSRAS